MRVRCRAVTLTTIVLCVATLYAPVRSDYIVIFKNWGNAPPLPLLFPLFPSSLFPLPSLALPCPHLPSLLLPLVADLGGN